MTKDLERELNEYLDTLKDKGLNKEERILNTPQSGEIEVNDGKKVINFCANNYLGLSNNKEVIEASKEALDRWGYGLSSVRFICGTQQIHKDLEAKMSSFLKTDDTILFSSCFDANGALFEPLLKKEDAIISDELNHASIIDGVRLCKAQRFRYKHSNMKDLERCLIESKDCRRKLIATDGVFSMDGDIAKLKEIVQLANKYDALVMVDDSHATGYIGDTGRGTCEYCGVEVDLISTTFGKALGGASGGCISGKQCLIDLFREHARPYLFSNTLAPAIAGGTIKVLELIEKENPYRIKTLENAKYFRSKMEEAGFDLVKGDTAIVPVMLYNELTAVKMAEKLLDEGVYVIGFCYPVVPLNKARIRVQLSAVHTKEHLDRAIKAFIKIGKEMKII
ncbi:MAG: glycine C-acetyltransferase [Sphaerochaetaceae bacterium]|nr:glycine C-acetyltransferase [Sphaerochaetaceae bacterium]